MKEYEIIPEKENTTFHPGRCAKIVCNGALVGYLGEVGAVEKVLERAGMKEYEIIPEKENTTFHPGRCAKIVCNGALVGYLGEVHPDVLENYGLTQRVYVCEIDTDVVFENSDRTIIFKSLPKYPSTSRDIALTVKDEVYVKDIEDIIKANG